MIVLGVFTTPLFAQDEAVIEETTAIQEEIVTDIDEASDTTTLSEDISISEDTGSDISFLSILFATITPALLFVIAYLLIKMSSK